MVSAQKCNYRNKMPATTPFELVPYLSVTDAPRAVGFYTKVFGVPPHVLLNMPDGRLMHCEFRIGNARLFLSEELREHGGTPSPQSLGGTSVALHLYVDNCDAVVESMKDSGGEILMEPTDMFFGERFARVRDPFGHEWGISTLLREMSPEEIQEASNLLFATTD